MYVLVLFSSEDFNFSFSSNNAFLCSNEIEHGSNHAGFSHMYKIRINHFAI